MVLSKELNDLLNQIREKRATTVYSEQYDATTCTKAGSTDSSVAASPMTDASDGYCWVIRAGNYAPVQVVHNGKVTDRHVGSAVIVGVPIRGGDGEIVNVNHLANVAKFDPVHANAIAAGPVLSPSDVRPLHNFTATSAPAVTDDEDDGYSVISDWCNTTTKLLYGCVDATAGAAVWRLFLMISSFAQGDLFYGSAANTLAALVKNTSATRYLSNTGSSNNPAWAQVNLTNGVTGTLPVTNGGTGLATFAQGDLPYASASNTLAALTKDTNSTRYLSNQGTSNNPSWNQVNLANGVTGTLPMTAVEGNSSATVSTTDATVTTLQTIATASNISYAIETTVVARRTGGSAGSAGDSAGYKLFGLFKNVAGTLTQVGSTIKNAIEDQAGWDADFDVSGTDIRVRVIGAINNNVNWGSFTIQRAV